MENDFLNLLPESVTIEGSYATRDVYIDGRKLSPKKSQRIVNHSPDGFNWSYGGSGPAQLALAILLEYLPKEATCNCYQKFKFGFIAGLPKTDFIKTINLRETLREILERNE